MDSPDSESSEASAALRLPGVIGVSDAFQQLMQRIMRIAPTDVSVLIEGETGSGKELAARALHYSSPRKSKPFVALNCGAIPEALIESELFGHTRGAFTDAKTAHPGVVGQAHAGTLFLDEIDSLPPKGQVAMLRFLQDRRYRPLGSDCERVSEARVVAATNRPLADLVESGHFRSDLMYRLEIIRLRTPPLRERRADVAPLTEHFLKLFASRYQLPFRPLRADCWDWLMSHDWPGNVRELESTLHRAVLLAEGSEVVLDEARAGREPQDAATPGPRRESPQDEPRAPARTTTSPRAPAPRAASTDFQSAKAHAIADFERRYVSELLEQTDYNITAAARLARKERRAFGKLVKKLGITRAAP